MDYNEKIDDKPNNLIALHEKHEKFFEDKMKWIAAREKLNQNDERFWIKSVDKKQIYFLNISGSCLLACGSGLFFWRMIKIITFKESENPKLILKALLFDLRLRYFHDEDAQGGGMFTGETSDGKKFAYCYISPDFPEGYWENHSLESKAVLPW